MNQVLRKKIVVFGAAFDPPHLGHEEMAKKMVELGFADEVWFIPCKQHPFDKNMSDLEDRLEMTQIVVRRLNETVGDYFVCSPIEMVREGKSYTYDTLREIATQNPNAEVSFLMGSDQLIDFEKWYKWREMLADFRVYVYPRPGKPLEPWYEGMRAVEGVTMYEHASSIVREKESAGSSTEDDISPDVQLYIERRGLYGTKNI